MSRLGLLGLTAGALILGGVHCSSEEAAKPKLRVGMLHWAAYAPINVADKKGLWAEEGVDVEVLNVTSNQALNEALETGKIDVALDMIGSWVGIHLKGTKLKVIGETDWSYGGDQIIAKKGLDKTKLKGSTIGVYLDQPSVNFFLGKYLATLPQPLKLSEVTTSELATAEMDAAFIAGQFQMTVNYFPQSASQLTAEAQGEELLTSRSAGFEGVIPEGFVGRADNIAKISPDTLKRFIKGWYKAVQWVYLDPDQNRIDESHWPEFSEILRNETFKGDRDGAQPYSETELRQFVANVKIHGLNQSLCVNEGAKGMLLKNSTRNSPQPIKDYLTELKSFLDENGELASVAPDLAAFTGGDGIFDNTATVAALKELGAACQ